MALAVRRISEPVKQHNHPAGRAVGFEYKRTIEVLGKVRRIDRAPVKIAVDGNALTGRQLLRDFEAKVLKESGFFREVPGPVRLIDLLCIQLPRHIGVPNLEGGTALNVVNAYCKKGQHRDRQEDPHPL